MTRTDISVQLNPTALYSSITYVVLRYGDVNPLGLSPYVSSLVIAGFVSAYSCCRTLYRMFQPPEVSGYDKAVTANRRFLAPVLVVAEFLDWCKATVYVLLLKYFCDDKYKLVVSVLESVWMNLRGRYQILLEGIQYEELAGRWFARYEMMMERLNGSQRVLQLCEVLRQMRERFSQYEKLVAVLKEKAGK